MKTLWPWAAAVQRGPNEAPPCLYLGLLGPSRNGQRHHGPLRARFGAPPTEGIYRCGSTRTAGKAKAGFTTPSSAAADVEISAAAKNGKG